MKASWVNELEAAYDRRQLGQMIFHCDQLLQDPTNAKHRGLILFWKARAHQEAGRAWHGQAISCYREGIAAAGRNRPLKSRMIADLSALHALSGDVPAFSHLLAEYRKIGDDRSPEVRKWGLNLWFNYGVALDNAMRYQEAADAFARAARMAEELNHPLMVGLSLHNLGGANLAMGRVNEAAVAMAGAEELLPDAHYQHKKLSRRAEYFLAAGDLVGAQQMITMALVHPQTDDMTRADVYITWARTLTALGRQAEAQEKARTALDYAVKAVHYPGIHRASQLLQQSA